MALLLDLTKFYLVTDHASLKYLFTTSEPRGQNARWMLRLQSFDFEPIVKPGKELVVPDALSRAPLDFSTDNTPSAAVKAAADGEGVLLCTQTETRRGVRNNTHNQPWILRRPDIMKLEQAGMRRHMYLYNS
jgi:hypothetical protein